MFGLASGIGSGAAAGMGAAGGAGAGASAMGGMGGMMGGMGGMMGGMGGFNPIASINAGTFTGGQSNRITKEDLQNAFQPRYSLVAVQPPQWNLFQYQPYSNGTPVGNMAAMVAQDQGLGAYGNSNPWAGYTPPPQPAKNDLQLMWQGIKNIGDWLGLYNPNKGSPGLWY